MSRKRTTPVRKSGRPARGEEDERRDDLLKAVLEIFQQQGFAGTSLDEISRVAHVAKRTIYEQFGGKEGLFAAAIERAATRLIGHFPHERGVSDLRENLISIGCSILTYVLQPKNIAIYRLVVGEAERQPNLARMFYGHGPARVIASIAELIAQHLPPERPAQDEPTRLARDFIGLVVLEIQQRATLGMLEPMRPGQIETHVARAVTQFLDAHGKKFPISK